MWARKTGTGGQVAVLSANIDSLTNFPTGKQSNYLTAVRQFFLLSVACQFGKMAGFCNLYLSK